MGAVGAKGLAEPAPRDDVPAVAGGQDATGLRIGIVAARFNAAIVDRLLDGAMTALAAHGADPGHIRTVWVPGALEIPLALQALARRGDHDALVALGAVVRGETPHFDVVAAEVASGCSRVALDTGLAVGFGVVTTDTWDQARARAGGVEGNKGADAALAAVETANLLRTLVEDA